MPILTKSGQDGVYEQIKATERCSEPRHHQSNPDLLDSSRSVVKFGCRERFACCASKTQMKAKCLGVRRQLGNMTEMVRVLNIQINPKLVNGLAKKRMSC